MPGQIEVQTVSPGVHQRLQPRRTSPVLGFHSIGRDKDLHAQIAPHRTLALCFRQPSHGVEVVCLHAIEIVFRLGIDHAEHRIGIRLTRDVRNAPVIAGDGDVPSLLLPALEFLVLGTGGMRAECECGRDKQS